MSKFWQKKYISKHTGAEIDEAVEAVLDGDVGTTVVANPTLAGTEAALTGLQVDETKYSVGGMTNPMTAAGDMIVGGTDGAPDKLAKASESGCFLRGDTSDDLTKPRWAPLIPQNFVRQAGNEGKCIYAAANTYGIGYGLGKPASDFGLGTITTAPSADNTDGIKIVVLSSEPARKYNGYLYIITA